MPTFHRVPWADLGRDDLYDLVVLRQRVFVVEQRCAFLDADGLDRLAVHVLARAESGALVACARVFAAGVTRADAVVGRVVTAPEVRGEGLGRAIMRESVAVAEALSPGAPVYLGAQAHLERFYGSLGFVACTALYDEDGIPHVGMRRPAGARD